MNLWKPLELLATGAARLAWPGFQAVNHRFKSQTFYPAVEEPRADKSATWLAAYDRLLVPSLRP